MNTQTTHGFSLPVFNCINSCITNRITSRISKSLVLLSLFLSLGVGTTWAADATIAYSGSTTTNMTGANDAATVGLNTTHWSVVGSTGSHTLYPGLNKNGYIALYYNANGSNSITVTNSDGTNIASIVVTYTGTSYNNGVVKVGGNAVSASGGSYSIGATSFSITNGNTSNTQVRISSIEITLASGGGGTKYTVSFDVGASSGSQADIQEANVGAGITLPAGPTPTCSADGWSFAGWAAANVASSTTTAPTLYSAGDNYKPADDCTLYAVYSKTTGGGSSNVVFNFGYSDDWGESSSWSGTDKDDVTATKSGVTVTHTRGTGSIYANATATRFYKDNTLTFAVATGSITSIVFTCTTYKTDITSDVGTCTATSSEFSWSGSASSVSFSRPSNADSYAQFSAATITIGSGTTNYWSSPTCVECTNKLTINKGTPSNGAFELNKTGLQETCDGLVVTVTDIAPASGYQFDRITQSGVAAGNVTIDNTAKTVTYAADVTGTSTITVVFEETESKVFELVTDENDLEDGAEIVITNSGVTYAMSTTQNSNNRGETSDFTTNLAKTTVTVEDGSDVQILTLGISNDNWTFYDSGADGYLYAASSSQNYLRTQSTNDANGEWEISISDDEADIEAQGTSTNNLLRYNNSNSIFSCYGSGQKLVKIFQKSSGPTISPTASLSTFSYNLGEGPSAYQTFAVKGNNLTGNLTVTAPTNYQVSLDGSSWAGSQTLIASAGKVNNETVYVRLVGNLSRGTYNGDITISGGDAAEKMVAAYGEVVIECTTPNLAFAGNVTTMEKVLGSGKFTIVASSSDNTLGAAITYGSSNTEKATVDASTGEVTLVQATGSGSPVIITATLVAKSTDVACQNEVSISYELTIYNQVTWLVNDEEYTAGSPDPTTQVLQGGQITQLPSIQDGSIFCGGKVFVGWTDHAIDDPVDVGPTPMYKKVGDMSGVYITGNTTYYAVFAASSGAGTTPTLTQMGSGDTFADGDNIVIVAKDENIAVFQQTVSTSYVDTWNFDNNVETVASNDKNWLTVSAASADTWYLGDAALGYINNSGNNLYCNANQTEWTLIDNGDGSFKLNSDDKYLSYRTDLSTVKWRMGGATYGTNGVVNLYIYKYSGSSVSYSDYSTVCGTCLPAPSSPTVTVKSDRATISWSAVDDATGYSVTCSAGSVSVSGTKATITGLTPTTSYTYTIRSQGSDPYSCFPAFHGNFTTAACEDSPVLGEVTVTPTTATIPWTCEAATATIRVYTNDACTDQVGADHTLCTSPFTVEGLTSSTTYYYKVLAGGTCASVLGSFTTEELKLDIAEWQTNAVIVSYNGDADLTLTTFTEETHGDPHANVAEDIFFSKYFEAALNVKLLGIFNGTMSSVDLSNYQLGLAQAGKGKTVTQSFAFTKFSDFVKSDERGLTIGGLTADELLLKPNEELILITYKNGDDDDIVACAKNNDEHSKFSTYVRISTPSLQFSGDDVVSLLNPDGDMIDLIGAGTKADGLDRSGNSFKSFSSGIDKYGFMDGPGWYTSQGYQAHDDNTETSGYGLSTNRCLLIRRKHVKSGYNAVTLNTTEFVTLGDTIYDGVAYEGEWKGVQIPGSTTQGTKPGISGACTGFEVVGGYNYNDYYVDFQQYGVATVFDDLKSDPFNGTYIIPVVALNDKACTFVRVDLKDGDGNLVIRKDVKVPIMISGSKLTTDEIFHSNYKDEYICRECDVVILDGASLTKVADGTTDDITAVRNLKVYPGGKLIVPAGTTYSVNSLSFRRQEDQLSTADIQGDLTIKESGNNVFFDLRVDPSNWHYIALPYDCNVADIRFVNDDVNIPTLGTDFLLKYYDGAKRAATQAGGCWEMVQSDGVLKKGIGYIFGIPGSGKVQREFRFPMSNEVVTEEKAATKQANGVYAYGCDKEMTEVRANHRGWNLLGNPYLLPYESDIESPVMTGKIVPDYSTDPWDGHYKFDPDPSTNLRYIVEPVDNGRSEYVQVALTDYEMKPFTSYFVQIGGDDPEAIQGVQFNKAKVIRTSPVRRSPASYEDVEDNHPVWCAVNITNAKGEKDETTMLISNDFTNGYDMMDDLVKMRGTYYQYAQITTKPVLASRNDEGEMAFNALPDSTARLGIPLNYFAAAAGQYKIALDGRYSLDEITDVQLYDSQLQTWHNLLTEDYSFAVAKKEDNTTRFKLYVTVERKQPQTPTEIDNIYGKLTLTANDRTLLLSGLHADADIYVYDVSGKLIDSGSHFADSDNGVWRTTVPTQGVYFVRVNIGTEQQTLNTIVY